MELVLHPSLPPIGAIYSEVDAQYNYTSGTDACGIYV